MHRRIRELFGSWVKSHPATKGLLHKSFPYYDDLSYVFDKDQTTGARSETFVDAGSNVPNMFNDGVPLSNSHHEDIPTIYSQGVHMSLDKMFGTRAGQVSERKNCSSGSKRKRGGQHYEMVEVIRSAMEFENDQLKAIADWPKEKTCNGGRIAC
uniref:Retrotransposon protein n=1 Tax=Cucumis melo TaxID=3656 RepID=A0A9I9D407_CUCME